MPLETLGEAASFLGREGGVERGRRMRVQVVLDQYDLFGIRKIHVGQFLERLRVIHGGVMVGDLDFAPALQRGERHEYVGHAVTLVLVVVPDRLPRLGRDRLARLDDQLCRSFVQTNEGTIEITRLLVGFQHVFHRRDKGRVGVGWNHPLPIAMGLESVFFKVRPIVLSLAFSTMFNSTTFSSSNRRLQRAKPSGAGEQARAISLASVAPSKIRGRAEFGLYLRTSVASKPSSTNCRRALPTVLTLVSNAAAISPSVQPSPASEVSAFSRMRAFVINCADRLPDLSPRVARAPRRTISPRTSLPLYPSLPRISSILAPAAWLQRFRNAPKFQGRGRLVGSRMDDAPAGLRLRLRQTPLRSAPRRTGATGVRASP